ncbi:MAG: L-seryl-tRNA(Sec) selenium transferase [Planctomycetes bacterium]|nr:L-seryl-tRNA(Sec) selenium transferase [Planctomycetota bacterium]
MDAKTNDKPDLRTLPKVDELLQLAVQANVRQDAPRAVLRSAARRVVDALREDLKGGKPADMSKNALLFRFEKSVQAQREHSLGRAVNATGVVLHTGLGRAPLSQAVAKAMVDAAGPCALEIDRDSGERGHRDHVVSELLRELLQVEDGTAVNNNAAATLLSVNTFALGKEVIVSRGELVEIGGSYRMPAVVERGGAKLIEVGTTNRTRLQDYKSAVGPRTGLIMKVHTSNYRIHGFAEEASLEELVQLGREAGIPVVHDLGSGLLTKALAPALADEPTVAESVAAGPDVILFSGDKLLGGPQAGIIVGRRAALAAIRGNPMFRAMRLDKIIFAALEQTLRIHLEGEAASAIPALERLNLTFETLQNRAVALAAKIAAAAPELGADVRESLSEAGSGSAPTIGLKTACVTFAHRKDAAASFAQKLRMSTPAVFARVRDGRIWVDPRTLAPGDDEIIVNVLKSIL